MACLFISINHIRHAELAIAAFTGVSLSVSANQPEVTVGGAKLATLTISEVCSVGDDSLVVLAASDGPLRTKNGGYILLDPATNPS